MGDGRWDQARAHKFVAGEPWDAVAQGVAGGSGRIGGGARQGWLPGGQGDVSGRGAEDSGLAAGGGAGRAGDGVAAFSGRGTARVGGRAGASRNPPRKRGLAQSGRAFFQILFTLRQE